MIRERIGLPHENSVFSQKKLDAIYDEIRHVYQLYPQPLVIGYSGGKDSTATLQLVWEALVDLPESERQKPVFVIASDTLVETPVIVDYIDSTLHRINEVSKEQKLPFKAEKVIPELNGSFWVNLLGRGYPAPTSRFRWCTDRLKISPANRFIESKVTEYGEVIVVLGVRKTESATRMQLMNTYQEKGQTVLRRHTSLTGAYVYAPIADFSTDDVWEYLFKHESPWGNNNRDLAALYRSANAGECPLVIDLSTPSCGNSRFGCWVCTVAKRDSSMEAMIDSGEEWLQPLLDFREFLAETTVPENKKQFRSIRGRDGRVLFKKNGEVAARQYELETSKEMLKELLEAQQEIRKHGPDSEMSLISEEELHEIRRLWRVERQDTADSIPKIFREVNGYDLDWPVDDNLHFDDEHETLLKSLCAEYEVPFELIAQMLEEERNAYGMARRAEIHKRIASVLGWEWRPEEEIVADRKRQQDEVNQYVLQFADS
jgi:DNA sulfur modification protein DndC